MANCITGLRILCGTLLLCVPALSPGFYALYLAGGVSDMLDGFIARKTGSCTAFGAKLDTAADLVFTAACLIRLLPALPLPFWLYLWAAAIAALRLLNLLMSFARHRRLLLQHTAMNKAAGLLLFLLPLALPFAEPACAAAVVCCSATAAALQEGYFIRAGREHL